MPSMRASKQFRVSGQLRGTYQLYAREILMLVSAVAEHMYYMLNPIKIKAIA